MPIESFFSHEFNSDGNVMQYGPIFIHVIYSMNRQAYRNANHMISIRQICSWSRVFYKPSNCYNFECLTDFCRFINLHTWLCTIRSSLLSFFFFFGSLCVGYWPVDVIYFYELTLVVSKPCDGKININHKGKKYNWVEFKENQSKLNYMCVWTIAHHVSEQFGMTIE